MFFFWGFKTFSAKYKAVVPFDTAATFSFDKSKYLENSSSNFLTWRF